MTRCSIPCPCPCPCPCPISNTSVVLNVTEGAGEFSSAEKSRFYRMARRSATETAAILQIVARRGHAPDELTRRARETLARVVSMLIKMTKPGGR